MKITVNAAMMKEMLNKINRDYFTLEGLENIIEWYDSLYGESYTFSPVDLCCNWTEYGDTPALNWNDFLSDYSYMLEGVENDNWLSDWEKIDLIIERLEDLTTVIRLSNSVLVGAL